MSSWGDSGVDVVSGEQGACHSCRFHRAGTSTLTQVVRLVPGHSRTETRDTVNEIRRDEEKQLAHDEGAKRLDASRPEFDHRPTGYPYCGAHETAFRYLNPEVKNPDQRSCTDWAPAVPQGTGACGTCAHRVAPSTEYDRTSSVFTDLAAEKTIGERVEGQWKKLRGSVASTAGWELRLAYDTLGRLHEPPAHVPWCRALSSVDEELFVLGEMVNVGRACPHWTEGDAVPTPTDADRAWADLDRARSDLAAERERRLGQSSDYNALHVNELLHLQRDVHEASGEYLRSGLRSLGIHPSEADEAVTVLKSTLYSHFASPQGSRPARVATPAPPEPVRSAPATGAAAAAATPDRGARRRKGGLLDALFGLSAPDTATTDMSAPDTAAPGSASVGVTAAPAGSPAGPAPSAPEPAARPQAPQAPEPPPLREQMDPPADGGIALDGEHRHPRIPTVGAVLLGRDAQQVHTSLYRLERLGGTALTERFDLSIVLAQDGQYQHVAVYVDGWTKGYYQPGRWYDAAVLLGRRFPVRIGFGFEQGRRSRRVGIWVQWLEDSR